MQTKDEFLDVELMAFGDGSIGSLTSGVKTG
jgi:hypothetical protein